MLKLSIVIPSYNAENCVLRCLKSILESINIDDFEVILVDDGSTDRTVEVVSRFINNNNIKNIRILHQKNSRQGAARNNGMSLALGKFIMFVDVDDYLNPIDFSKYYKLAELNKIDLFRFSFKTYDKEGSFTINHQSQFNDNYIYSGSEAILMDYTIGSSCGTLFRKGFLDRTDICFREDMAHEDCEFMLRLLPKVERMMVSSACLYTYCWNEGSTDRNKSVANLLRLKQSDIFVVQSYFATANEESLDSNIMKYYHQKGNSLLAQFLLSLIYDTKQLSLSAKMGLLSLANLQEVYPTRSIRTLSWKTTLLLFFLNKPIIERFLIRLFNSKK